MESLGKINRGHWWEALCFQLRYLSYCTAYFGMSSEGTDSKGDRVIMNTRKKMGYFLYEYGVFPRAWFEVKKTQKNKPVKILQPDSHLRQIKTQVFAKICLLLLKGSYQRWGGSAESGSFPLATCWATGSCTVFLLLSSAWGSLASLLKTWNHGGMRCRKVEQAAADAG